MYLLMQIYDLFTINHRSFLQTIPEQYRSSLKNIKTAKEPLPHDYFAYIIFSGEIPIGCIVYRLLSIFEKSIASYELEVCYIRLLEHFVSIKASETIEQILIDMPKILAGFNITLIRCSILDNNLLYPPLCAQLVRKNWEMDIGQRIRHGCRSSNGCRSCFFKMFKCY